MLTASDAPTPVITVNAAILGLGELYTATDSLAVTAIAAALAAVLGTVAHVRQAGHRGGDP